MIGQLKSGGPRERERRCWFEIPQPIIRRAIATRRIGFRHPQEASSQHDRAFRGTDGG
jgi:hypothetical protein